MSSLAPEKLRRLLSNEWGVPSFIVERCSTCCRPRRFYWEPKTDKRHPWYRCSFCGADA